MTEKQQYEKEDAVTVVLAPMNYPARVPCALGSNQTAIYNVGSVEMARAMVESHTKEMEKQGINPYIAMYYEAMYDGLGVTYRGF